MLGEADRLTAAQTFPRHHEGQAAVARRQNFGATKRAEGVGCLEAPAAPSAVLPLDPPLRSHQGQGVLTLTGWLLFPSTLPFLRVSGCMLRSCPRAKRPQVIKNKRKKRGRETQLKATTGTESPGC